MTLQLGNTRVRKYSVNFRSCDKFQVTCDCYFIKFVREHFERYLNMTGERDTERCRKRERGGEEEEERDDVIGVGCCSPGRLTFLEKWLNYFWVYVAATGRSCNQSFSSLFRFHFYYPPCCSNFLQFPPIFSIFPIFPLIHRR